LISDLRLPGRPGTDLIAEAGNNTSVLLITAYASVSSAMEAMRMGAADYLAKCQDPRDYIRAF